MKHSYEAPLIVFYKVSLKNRVLKEMRHQSLPTAYLLFICRCMPTYQLVTKTMVL